MFQMRKESDKSTRVVFVDLIKAFNSINHKLLFSILEKIGIPDRVIMVMKNLYKIQDQINGWKKHKIRRLLYWS